jgi:hypothetical protein
MTLLLRLVAITVWVASMANLLAFFGVFPLEGVGLILPLAAIPGYASVGLVLVLHRPTSSVGWLMLGMGGVPAIGAVASVGSAELANGAVLIGLALMLVFFPDGRLPSTRWAVPVAILVGGWALTMIAPAFIWRRDDGFEFHVGVLVSVLGALACSSAPFVRRRRAGLVERAQLRWLGAAAAATGLMAAVALGAEVSTFVPYGLGELASGLGLLFGVFGIPATVLIAIGRYRLYEIDRIISRSITYLAVGAVVATIYSIPVLVLPSVLGESSDLVVALSTLAAAAAFNPLRKRIQQLVDRRFNRARFDAQRELDRFAEGLREEVELGSVTGELETVIARTVAPVATSIWIRQAK